MRDRASPGGTEHDLEELVAAVQQRWHLEPVTDSKFARGLALATGVPAGRTEDWQRELRRLRVQRWVRRTREEAPTGAGMVTERLGPREPEPQPVVFAEAEPGEERATPQVSVLASIDRGVAGEAELAASAAGAPEVPEVAGTEPLEAEEPELERPELEEPEVLEEQEATEKQEPEVSEPEQPEAEVAEPEELEEPVTEEPEPEVLEEPPTAEEPGPEVAEPEVAEPDLGEAEAAEQETPGPEFAEPAASVGEREAVEQEQAAAEGEAGAAHKKERARPGIVSDDTMDEAARKTLLFHFERMLKHESGTREGEDAEELHDMRVATRRMRAALRVFDGYVDRAAVKPYLKALRRTGRTLGTVRDLDVFHEKTMRYLGGLPEGHESDLDPLLGAWRTERDGARAVMIDYLDSQPHKRFARRFGEFLETPGAAAVEPFDADGEPLPRLVRDVLPVVLFERLAAVRAFAEWLDEAGRAADSLPPSAHRIEGAAIHAGVLRRGPGPRGAANDRRRQDAAGPPRRPPGRRGRLQRRRQLPHLGYVAGAGQAVLWSRSPGVERSRRGDLPRASPAGDRHPDRDLPARVGEGERARVRPRRVRLGRRDLAAATGPGASRR